MGLVALTSAEERFAENYVTTRSLARAYKATNPNGTVGWTAAKCHREGRRYYDRFHVRERVDELIDAGAQGAVVTVTRLTEIFMSIYEADPNELSSVRVGACRYCNGLNHRYHWREHEYLEALTAAETGKTRIPDVGGGLDYDHTAAPHPECPKCGGEGLTRTVFHDTENLSEGARYLYGGVKQTKDGMQLIVADRMKALELVGRVIGAFNDKMSLTANVRSISAATVAMAADPAQAAKLYLEMVNGIKAD